MDEAYLGPQRRHDQLLTSGGADRGHEVAVFPGIDRGPVDRDDIGEDLCDLVNGELVAPGRDVHGGDHRRQAKQLCGFGHRGDVGYEGPLFHRLDGSDLHRLVIDSRVPVPVNSLGEAGIWQLSRAQRAILRRTRIASRIRTE